jgi:predicted nuclease of predicted toxin-antitoxin system
VSVVRFHADANVSHAVVFGTRARGIDIVSAVDAGLRIGDDPAHIASALREGRVIVTHDRDFVLHHRNGVVHGGIVFIADQRAIGAAIEAIMLVAATMSAEEMAGRLEFF